MTAFVQNDRGQILLRQRPDELWVLPAGTRRSDEYVGHAAQRAALEHAGVGIEILDVIGIYSDPLDLAADPPGVGDGISICLRARFVADRALSQPPAPIRWVDPDALESVRLDEESRRRIDHALEGRAEPFIDERARQYARFLRGQI